jgi:RNA polymerase sigma-70 factor (ECF subfamily)
MDAEQLGRLIDSRAAALALYARQWCRSPDDVVQEAFAALSRLAPADPVAWLYRAVRNRAISAGRSEQRRRQREAAAASRDWFQPAPGDRLDASAAADALQSLPADEREVVVAHVWGGLSFAQIGELTSTSAATACRRYAAGLARLRERLNQPCTTPNYPPN